MERVARTARAAAPDVEVMAGQSASGPDAIQGPFGGALAVPGMLTRMREAESQGPCDRLFRRHRAGGARALLNGPVVGIGEAAMHVASLVGHSFAVITTLSRSVPVLEHNVVCYGISSRCRAVLVCDIPVLALHDPLTGAAQKISDIIVEPKIGARKASCWAVPAWLTLPAISKHSMVCRWWRGLARPSDWLGGLRPSAQTPRAAASGRAPRVHTFCAERACGVIPSAAGSRRHRACAPIGRCGDSARLPHRPSSRELATLSS